MKCRMYLQKKELELCFAVVVDYCERMSLASPTSLFESTKMCFTIVLNSASGLSTKWKWRNSSQLTMKNSVDSSQLLLQREYTATWYFGSKPVKYFNNSLQLSLHVNSTHFTPNTLKFSSHFKTECSVLYFEPVSHRERWFLLNESLARFMRSQQALVIMKNIYPAEHSSELR